ncbi:MAG: hypothetical protein N3A58_07175 [Spirochaetes bacterium]|nr:hypothetical protein [Spirochaetota bacterium]
MIAINYIEIFGYIASLIIAISLLMTSIYKLRIFNLAGSFIFSLYGIFINSIPVFLLNLFICFINLYFLINIFKRKEYFSLYEVEVNYDYLQKFINFYIEDIKKYYKNFNLNKIKEESLTEKYYFYFILRDLLPAGLFILKKLSDQEYFIVLDYVIKQYRDFKIAKFIFFEKSDLLKSKGINKLVTKTSSKNHKNYLKSIGFKEVNKVEGKFIKEI